MSGFTLDGAVTLSGVFGDSTADVKHSAYTFSSPGCSAPPCPFDLRQFDVELASFHVGNFEFVGPRLELSAMASGWRTGETVRIPTGALRLDVYAGIEVDGQHLLGTDEFRFEFANIEPVGASVDGDGVFTVQHAEFNIYGERIVINTE